MSELVLIANAADGTISTLALHREPEPHLEVLATSGEWTGCSTFAVDVKRDLVFAAYKGPGIATLRLDRETGTLTEVSRRGTDGSLNYLALTPDRRSLLGASYSGGFGAVWPIDGEELGEPHSQFKHANLHSIIEAGGFVYAASLGDDLVAQFGLRADGTLRPLDPPTVSAPEGSGPRHIIAHDGALYLLTEFSGEAIRYHIERDGGLRQAETVSVIDPSQGLDRSRFGADPMAEHLIWGADLHLAGRFLLTSERTGSTIAATAVAKDGTLGETVAFSPTEAQPRGFAVTDDGTLVVAVGERSTEAALSSVGHDGALTPLGSVPIGAGANWVRILA